MISSHRFREGNEWGLYETVVCLSPCFWNPRNGGSGGLSRFQYEEQAEALAERSQHARLQARGLPHELGRPKHSFEQVARVFVQHSGCGGNAALT